VEKGEFTFEGKAHVLRPLHGAENNALHGNWTEPWTVSKQSDNQVILDISCKAQDGPARRTPYEYGARQILTLTNEGLTVDMEITNRGATLPFSLGLHPFLPRPQDTVVRLGVSLMENTRADMIPDPAKPLVPVPADWTLIEGFNISNKNLSPAARGFGLADLMDNSFPGIDPAKGATVTWPSSGREMTVTASENCTYGVIFVPGAKNDAPAGQQSFFCLELTTGGINMHNRPVGEAGGAVLKAGETLRASTRYSIRKL
jgi:aldose 1-epimerase